MEKLIELLNEYEGQDTRYYDKDRGFCYGWGDDSNYELEIISKKYGFIKWLLDNDKIDFDIVKAYTTRPIRDNMNKYTLEDYTRYERVLMLLSIQDSPIDFLTKIIKN